MKKRLVSIFLVILLCAITCLALVACSNSAPDKFLEKFAEAKKYTVTEYANDNNSSVIMIIKRNSNDFHFYVPIFYDNYAFETTDGYEVYESSSGTNYNVYNSKTIPFQNLIDSNKAQIIQEFVPNYEKGTIAKDALKNKFEKKDGKWYLLDSDGAIRDDYGYIVMNKGSFIAYDTDGKCRYALKLSCGTIEKPKV